MQHILQDNHLVKRTFLTPNDLTIFTALAEVQHTSVSAFTSADVLTYETAGLLDTFLLIILPVIDEDKEQPAFISGNKTFVGSLILQSQP